MEAKVILNLVEDINYPPCKDSCNIFNEFLETDLTEIKNLEKSQYSIVKYSYNKKYFYIPFNETICDTFQEYFNYFYKYLKIKALILMENVKLNYYKWK